MQDEVARAVRSLYEAFPYPERMPGGASDPYLDLMRSFAATPAQGRGSFLDAGCGTGLTVLGAATLYPHYDVYGCDINRVALAEIASELEQHGLSNAQIHELDLAGLEEDFGPAQGFDAIFCTGVLHHVCDPAQALRRLAGRLAPQGVLRLMVYSERGRADLYRFARVVQKLWPCQAWSWEKRVEMAQSLMGELERHFEEGGSAPPPLRGTWSDATTVGCAEFADRYLHPHDKPYTTASLRTLIEQAGLRLLGWFEPRDWDLDRLLPELAESPDAPRELWDRIEIVEELFERPKFDMYLVGAEFTPRRLSIGPATLLSTNPQLFFEQVTVRGVPLAQAARLRTGPIEPLSRTQGRLLQSLGRRFACLAELCQEWGENLDRSLLEEARSLVSKGFLYPPHPLGQTER
jgi:SAM-dependent methyltransferase